MVKTERPRRGDRLTAKPSVDGPETTSFSDRKRCGAIGLIFGRRVHARLLLSRGAAGLVRAVLEKMPRTGSGGRGDDLRHERPPIPLTCGGGERCGWSRS